MHLKNSIVPTSPYADYCDGYGNPGAQGNGYVLGFVMDIGKTKLSHIAAGSRNLDEIDAFDKAEVKGATIGQINMITVSSFCGPMGYIWGYDLARHDTLRQIPQIGVITTTYKNQTVPVYSLKPLLEATKALFGTVAEQRFPIMPGSHVPCAKKSITRQGPIYLYSGLAIGIPQDRDKNACLLMEDIGWTESDSFTIREQLHEKLAQSILKIGENQHVVYKEIFLDIKISFIEKDEIGCALVACPYLTLARNALPNQQEQLLKTMFLSEWNKSIK